MVSFVPRQSGKGLFWQRQEYLAQIYDCSTTASVSDLRNHPLNLPTIVSKRLSCHKLYELFSPDKLAEVNVMITINQVMKSYEVILNMYRESSSTLT